MPRSKPTSVEGVRIDLGTKERQILEDFALSYRLQSVLPSLAAILKDASAVYAIAIIYELVTGRDLPYVISPDDSVGEILGAIRDSLKAQKVPGAEGGTFGNFLNAGTGPGSPIGSLLAALGIDPLDTGVA